MTRQFHHKKHGKNVHIFGKKSYCGAVKKTTKGTIFFLTKKMANCLDQNYELNYIVEM